MYKPPPHFVNAEGVGGVSVGIYGNYHIDWGLPNVLCLPFLTKWAKILYTEHQNLHPLPACKYQQECIINSTHVSTYNISMYAMMYVNHIALKRREQCIW